MLGLPTSNHKLLGRWFQFLVFQSQTFLQHVQICFLLKLYIVLEITVTTACADWAYLSNLPSVEKDAADVCEEAKLQVFKRGSPAVERSEPLKCNNRNSQHLASDYRQTSVKYMCKLN